MKKNNTTPTYIKYKTCKYNETTRCTRGDVRSFLLYSQRICIHKTKFLTNIFKYCFKNYIKLHEFAKHDIKCAHCFSYIARQCILNCE